MRKAKVEVPKLKIWDSVSEGRDVFNGAFGDGDPNPEVRSLISETTGDFGAIVASSYPHLTQANTQRGEHVTSSRVVDDRHQDYVIHQRYSQDNKVGSIPVHDRFFAVMRNGTVHKATPKIIKSTSETHVPGKTTLLSRGDDISKFDGIKQYVVFEVDDVVDDKHPPLSPRSRDRTL